MAALMHRVKELENTVQAHQTSLAAKDVIIENNKLIIEQLQEALKIALARKYGRSAETYVDPNQIDLFDEAETGVIIDNDSGEVINVPGHTRTKKRGKRQPLPDYLPREIGRAHV